MVDRPLHPQFRRLVADWLNNHQELLQCVFDEVANGLAPLIADEIVKHVAEALVGKPDPAELLHLQAVVVDCAEELERLANDGPPAAECTARNIAMRLQCALGRTGPFPDSPAVSDKGAEVAERDGVQVENGGGA